MKLILEKIEYLPRSMSNEMVRIFQVQMVSRMNSVKYSRILWMFSSKKIKWLNLKILCWMKEVRNRNVHISYFISVRFWKIQLIYSDRKRVSYFLGLDSEDWTQGTGIGVHLNCWWNAVLYIFIKLMKKYT